VDYTSVKNILLIQSWRYKTLAVIKRRKTTYLYLFSFTETQTQLSLFTDLRNLMRIFSTFPLACLFYFSVHQYTKFFGPKVK